MIYELEKEINTNSNDIDVKDVETLQLFLHAKYTKGIIGYDTTFVKNMYFHVLNVRDNLQ